MNPRANPRRPQHRAGQPGTRPLADLLADHNPTTGAGTPGSSNRHGRISEVELRIPTTRAAATQLGVDPATLETLDVFDAASLVRVRAHAGIKRLYQCRPTLRRARRTLELSINTTALISTVTARVVATQVAETQLVNALDKLETATAFAHTARQEQAQFYPYGGHLVATPPCQVPEPGHGV